MQALETIKLILGISEPLIGRLLLFDALTMEFRVLKTRRDPDCPVCGDNPTITDLIDYNEYCGLPVPPELEEQRAAEASKATGGHAALNGSANGAVRTAEPVGAGGA